jgi:hypothetical protein
MPEKGWVIVTIREQTKKLLKQVSQKEGKSINDLIVSHLTSQRPRVSASKDTFSMTSHDREILKKLYNRLIASRNNSQAAIIKRILGEV